MKLASIGLGSYLGEVSAQARRAYAEATTTALTHGCNVLDTASNYRDQASERDLGQGIRAYLEAGGRREEFLVATKVGFLHGDADEADTEAWFSREYIDSGVLTKADVRASHSLSPTFILHEIQRSRRNLGLETLDVVYLHNPEHALEWGMAPAAFYAAMEDAFAALESAVDAGHIRYYGVATWDGLRVTPDVKGHMELVKLIHHAGAARMRLGGKASEHHFRAIELPVNAAMTEAALVPTQPFRFGAQTVLACARDVNFLVCASASLMQMRLAGRVPEEYAQVFDTQTDAETLLQFTRSVPGVTTALVGMGKRVHVEANLALAARMAPAPGIVKTLLGTGSLHGA